MLNTEIERKFLLAMPPFPLDGFPKKEIMQGYISRSPSIRLRQMGDEYFLTIKKGKNPFDEYEISLSEDAFHRLWAKIDPGIVHKTRYKIPLETLQETLNETLRETLQYSGLTAELDIYHGHLKGLLTVEVEFSNEEEAAAFIPPDWFGKDVTGDRRYFNSTLAHMPTTGYPLHSENLVIHRFLWNHNISIRVRRTINCSLK